MTLLREFTKHAVARNISYFDLVLICVFADWAIPTYGLWTLVPFALLSIAGTTVRNKLQDGAQE